MAAFFEEAGVEAEGLGVIGEGAEDVLEDGAGFVGAGELVAEDAGEFEAPFAEAGGVSFAVFGGEEEFFVGLNGFLPVQLADFELSEGDEGVEVEGLEVEECVEGGGGVGEFVQLIAAEFGEFEQEWGAEVGVDGIDVEAHGLFEHVPDLVAAEVFDQKHEHLAVIGAELEGFEEELSDAGGLVELAVGDVGGA